MGRLGCGGHGGVPVEEAAATVAGEQFAFAELVPGLGADAHAAGGALLIFSAGEAGALGDGEAIVADEVFFVDEGAEGLAFDGQSGEFGVVLLLALGGAGADFIERAGEGLDLGAGGGEGGLLRLSALEAGELLVFKALGLGLREFDLVLDGLSLGGGGDGVELGAEAGDLLAVAGDLAIELGAEGIFAREGAGGFSGLTLGGGQLSGGLGNRSGQGAGGLGDAGALQIHFLKFYEMFNLGLHRCEKSSSLGRGMENSG